ncbi:hypothetical protein KI688_008467 [Linnemannia hyalina]|uniref:Uncharacterized protein n=1 Tax=Linnemannia hyalina TaxID=64524 RepID=A0A9P7Y0D7_9FUNG|nr:hypothetical protein KI688_008467 [Linnemannia hyalina]
MAATSKILLLLLVTLLALVGNVLAWRIDLIWSLDALYEARLRSNCYKYDGKFKAKPYSGQQVCSGDGVFCIRFPKSADRENGGVENRVEVWYANTYDVCTCKTINTVVKPPFCLVNQPCPIGVSHSCGCDTPKYCQ